MPGPEHRRSKDTCACSRQAWRRMAISRSSRGEKLVWPPSVPSAIQPSPEGIKPDTPRPGARTQQADHAVRNGLTAADGVLVFAAQARQGHGQRGEVVHPPPRCRGSGAGASLRWRTASGSWSCAPGRLRPDWQWPPPHVRPPGCRRASRPDTSARRRESRRGRRSAAMPPSRTGRLRFQGQSGRRCRQCRPADGDSRSSCASGGRAAGGSETGVDYQSPVSASSEGFDRGRSVGKLHKSCGQRLGEFRGGIGEKLAFQRQGWIRIAQFM
jgi:hypothetical protein